MASTIDLSVTIESNMPAHENTTRPVYLEWMMHEGCPAYNQGVAGDPFTTPIAFAAMLNHGETRVAACHHVRDASHVVLATTGLQECHCPPRIRHDLRPRAHGRWTLHGIGPTLPNFPAIACRAMGESRTRSAPHRRPRRCMPDPHRPATGL